MSVNKWWGYIHSNGSIQVKVWFGDHQDIAEAYQSPFCKRVFEPFDATSREDALRILKAKACDFNRRHHAES